MDTSVAAPLPFDFGATSEPLAPYPASVRQMADGWAFMAGDETEDWILFSGRVAEGFEGTSFDSSGMTWTKAPLSATNAALLRQRFPFTAPVPVLGHNRTIGLGDRLGLAAPGHIRAVQPYDALPVLAQQSMRELSLTGRSYTDVLDAASFGAFREGFTRGFGADGDHLKTVTEVKHALSLGFTMITLDCGDHICNKAAGMDDAQLKEACVLPPALAERYLGKSFSLEPGCLIAINEVELRRCLLIYGAAIQHILAVYGACIAGREGHVDFEISIDETETPTQPLQHFFVANELRYHRVSFATVAPRFCGEFQKGVDYIGEVEQFERELGAHAAIARHFGHKLSIHSGSDKFSVFPAISRQTKGRFHVKTAGTSWLVAMLLVAEKAPALYRNIHKFALQHFGEARQYYHITTDPGHILDVDTLADSSLTDLFVRDDVRQLIHITYGLILCARDGDGYLFKDNLYGLWRRQSATYADMLKRHIGRHLALLYSGAPW